MNLLSDICNVLAAAGQTYIDLYEWQRSTVSLTRLPRKSAWNTHTTHSGYLLFTGIGLAHAVVKADFSKVRNLALPSLGFLFQVDQIIEFGGSAGLRLRPGASNLLNDVTQTSVVGRVGQGLALLFASGLGYQFVGHLGSDPTVLASLPSVGGGVADFLFENDFGDRLIIESKATFALLQNECSPVKTTLKNALEKQVDPWMGIVNPAPSKGYALYSCLREVGNATPSAISFVDPPPVKREFDIFLPPDWVRRHNYATWLRVMGLDEAAVRLRGYGFRPSQEANPHSVRLRRIRVGDRAYAVTVLPGRPRAFPASRFVIGMDTQVLELISGTIQGAEGLLFEYRSRRVPIDDEQPPLSILADGTIMGLVSVKSFDGAEDFII